MLTHVEYIYQNGRNNKKNRKMSRGFANDGKTTFKQKYTKVYFSRVKSNPRKWTLT